MLKAWIALLLVALVMVNPAWADDRESTLPTEEQDTPTSSETRGCINACVEDGEDRLDCEEACIQVAGFKVRKESPLCRYEARARAYPPKAL